MKQEGYKPRRHYSAELKQQILAECSQPGNSVAQVALAHSINANLVHKWRSQSNSAPVLVKERPEFIPVPIGQLQPPAQPAHIHIEIVRAQMRVGIDWPLESVGDCAAMLRELLR